jgi:hypothetical protein
MGAWLKLERQDLMAFAVCGLIGSLLARVVGPEWRAYAYLLVAFHLFLAYLVATRLMGSGPGYKFQIVPGILAHLFCLALIVGLGAARDYIPMFRLIRYGVAAIAVLERRWILKPVGEGLTPDALSGVALPQAQLTSTATAPQAQASQAQAPQIAIPGYASVAFPQTQQSVPTYRPETSASATPAPPAPARVSGYKSIAFPESESSVPTYRPEAAAPAPSAQTATAEADRAGKKAKGKPAPERSAILDATGQDHEDWLRYLATRVPTHRKAGSSIADEYHDWLVARAKSRAATAAAAGAETAARQA